MNNSNNQIIDVVSIAHFDIALEPCPFCDGTARFYKEIHGVKYYERISLNVSCGSCGASTMIFYVNDLAVRYPQKYSPMFSDYKPYTEFDAAKDAADSWNRRENKQ